jgi:hypothetical protein
LPPRAQVAALARDLLAGEGTRLRHVRTAGFVATRLSVLFAATQVMVDRSTLRVLGVVGSQSRLDELLGDQRPGADCGCRWP